MLIDIFNDNYEHIGTEEKRVAHTQGLWHRSFSCLAFSPKNNSLLLQKKTPGRYSFERPDYADITVGGHYEAGERIQDGIRELHEELGLADLTYADLTPLGLRQTAVTLGPTYIEREFQHWHLLPLDIPVESIPLADAEVSGLVELNIDPAIALATGELPQAPARHATQTEHGPHCQETTLHRTELIPNYLNLDQLYLRLFLAARRYSRGERDHLFW